MIVRCMLLARAAVRGEGVSSGRKVALTVELMVASAVNSSNSSSSSGSSSGCCSSDGGSSGSSGSGEYNMKEAVWLW